MSKEVFTWEGEPLDPIQVTILREALTMAEKSFESYLSMRAMEIEKENPGEGDRVFEVHDEVRKGEHRNDFMRRLLG